MAPGKLSKRGHLPRAGKQGSTLCTMVLAQQSGPRLPMPRRGRAPWLSWKEGVPRAAPQRQGCPPWTNHCVQCLKAQNKKGPHYTERQTESQRGDKNRPSSRSRGVAELKQKARFSDSSSSALFMTSCRQLKPGVIWLTQLGSEHRVSIPPQVCSVEHYEKLYKESRVLWSGDMEECHTLSLC